MDHETTWNDLTSNERHWFKQIADHQGVGAPSTILDRLCTRGLIEKKTEEPALSGAGIDLWSWWQGRVTPGRQK